MASISQETFQEAKGLTTGSDCLIAAMETLSDVFRSDITNNVFLSRLRMASRELHEAANYETLNEPENRAVAFNFKKQVENGLSILENLTGAAPEAQKLAWEIVRGNLIQAAAHAVMTETGRKFGVEVRLMPSETTSLRPVFGIASPSGPILV